MYVIQIRKAVAHKANASSFGRSKELRSGMPSTGIVDSRDLGNFVNRPGFCRLCGEENILRHADNVEWKHLILARSFAQGSRKVTPVKA